MESSDTVRELLAPPGNAQTGKIPHERSTIGHGFSPAPQTATESVNAMNSCQLDCIACTVGVVLIMVTTPAAAAAAPAAVLTLRQKWNVGGITVCQPFLS